MISYELTAADLADTHFAISPLAETVFSLWALADPGRHALHLPWLRSVRGRLGGPDADLLLALVGPARSRPGFHTPSRPVPDFLTPRPRTFEPAFEDELAIARVTSPKVVRRDLLATHAPRPTPTVLRSALTSGSRAVAALRDGICELLQRYWELALAPAWQQMRLVLEADTTYRARQLATSGARLLFTDMHPNIRWRDGVLEIHEMMGHHHVAAEGRGLLLMPSLFASKPVPPLDPGEPPSLTYPSRGVATLWAPPPEIDGGALVSLVGRPRARLLALLGEPLPTIDIARRLGVTPSAVSQHLQVLHDAGLLTRTRHGRQVLYRRSELGDHLAAGAA